MCKYINPINTKTKFIILMHSKEYRKTKNGTGHFTNKSLINSQIFIGIDFSNNKQINKILEDKKNECFLLYPGENSIKLNQEPINSKKNIVIFIIDSTWPCSKKILRINKKLTNLKKISFISNKESQFKIKTQPQKYCLSTIESTQEILNLLNKHNIENINSIDIENFTKPFKEMVEYQIKSSKIKNDIRFKD